MKLRVTKGENLKKPWLVKDGDRVLDTFGTWDEAWAFAMTQTVWDALSCEFWARVRSRVLGEWMP